jgi:hypothetical protein
VMGVAFRFFISRLVRSDVGLWPGFGEIAADFAGAGGIVSVMRLAASW